MKVLKFEKLIAFAEATKLLSPGTGKPRISISTLYRWAHHGCRGIQLKAVVVGGRMHTTREWLSDFVSAISAARLPASRPRSPSDREREIARAELEIRTK